MWPVPAETLPVWWITRSAAFSVPELITELEGSPPGSARHDLLIALRHAEARAGQDPWGSPEHVRYAQAVLEIAVQWAMPAVERWAVAWLTASGESYLRLRWSSRSRDGRTRRDGLLPSPVSAVAADSGRAIVGCESGYVAEWTDGAGLGFIEQSAGTARAVWAAACRGELIFIAAMGGYVTTRPGNWTVPALPESLNVALGTAAISGNGDVACGDNQDRLLICPAGAGWLPPLRPPGDRRGASVVALSFDARSSVWAVWADGWITETRREPDGSWAWHTAERPLARSVTAAAFDGTCERVAIGYAGGEARVLHLSGMTVVPAWSGDGRGYLGGRIRSVTWSPGGVLAVSRAGSLLFGEPGHEPEQLSGDGTGYTVAFLDDDHLVTAREREIVGWAIRDIGSDVPDPLRNTITAVAVDPLDPGRTMVGTARGGVVRYDEHGSATLLVKDDGPIVGQVHELTRMGRDWLVAAQGGAYWMTGNGQPLPLPGPAGTASYVSLSVAARSEEDQSPGGYYACDDRVCTVSGGDPLIFADAVRDVRCGADGTVAAISDDGSIIARDGAGSEWSLPGPQPRPGRLGRSGWRLLAADAESVTVWNPAGQSRRDPDGQVQRLSRHGQDAGLGRLPAGARAALALGAGKLVAACPDRGVAVARVGDQEHPGQITGVNTRATVIGASGHKIVAAAGQWLAGYDMMPAAGDAGDDAEGVIRIKVTAEAGSCQVRLPRGDAIGLDRGLVGQFGESSGGESRGLPSAGSRDSSMARVVNAAIQIGDQLWRCGLDLALDLARGDNPDRPVRLVWDCDTENGGLPWNLDDLPWELVHPAMYPLGWFADPPITSVRSVHRPDVARSGALDSDASGPAGALVTRHRMQVVRGIAEELGSSDEAYLYTSRRTRLRSVKMLDARPVRIVTRDDLYQALREPVDILQVWAHCGPDRTVFSADAEFGTDDLADLLAPQVSRLAVIVGCQSGALARGLVGRGVEAVVAMRTEVFSGTVQPLVADLIALVLGGMRIDLAFGRALHSYILTGQPGAAAVPMLYLADGSTGELFRS